MPLFLCLPDMFPSTRRGCDEYEKILKHHGMEKRAKGRNEPSATFRNPTQATAGACFLDNGRVDSDESKQNVERAEVILNEVRSDIRLESHLRIFDSCRYPWLSPSSVVAKSSNVDRAKVDNLANALEVTISIQRFQSL